jgi:hypothetical protein
MTRPRRLTASAERLRRRALRKVRKAQKRRRIVIHVSQALGESLQRPPSRVKINRPEPPWINPLLFD